MSKKRNNKLSIPDAIVHLIIFALPFPLIALTDLVALSYRSEAIQKQDPGLEFFAAHGIYVLFWLGTIRFASTHYAIFNRLPVKLTFLFVSIAIAVWYTKTGIVTAIH